jgi:hypothetical protein
VTRDDLSFGHFFAEHVSSQDADLAGPDQTKAAKKKNQKNKSSDH